MEQRRIQILLKEYSESHQNQTNKLIHWICVPLIFFTIYGLIRLIPVPNFFVEISPLFNWANLALYFALIYYVFLSIPLFLGFIVWALIVAVLNEYLYNHLGVFIFLWFSIGLFIIAWIGQFIGHNIEGKKPSFLKDLQFLLIGPAWLMNFILKVVKY